jgi:hypothetical protein
MGPERPPGAPGLPGTGAGCPRRRQAQSRGRYYYYVINYLIGLRVQAQELSANLIPLGKSI